MKTRLVRVFILWPQAQTGPSDRLASRGVAIFYKNRLVADALPEPDLKYRSSSRAVFSVITAT